MEILNLPSRAVSRAVLVTNDSGPLSKVYYTTRKGRPVLISSDSKHMLVQFLPGDPPKRSYALHFSPAFRKPPIPQMLKREKASVILENDGGHVTWRVESPKNTSVLLADFSTTTEIVDRTDSYVPDFESVIRSAEQGQRRALEYLMSPRTIDLLSYFGLGAACIYGCQSLLTPYCVRFPEHPDVYLIAMCSEWYDGGEKKPIPGCWSMP